MDWIALKKRGIEFARKYRHVLLILAAGIVLMALPGGSAQEKEKFPSSAAVDNADIAPDLETSLSELLSKVSGAGHVEVLLTPAKGSLTVYQTNDSNTGTGAGGGNRIETVLLSASDRSETGLIKRIDPPVYRGAIVLCQGADNANIRLAIVEAVANATGLTSDKISVLKMK